MTQREFDESTDRGSCVSVACQFWRFACQEANETVFLRLSLGGKQFVDVARQEAVTVRFVEGDGFMIVSVVVGWSVETGNDSVDSSL